MVVFKRLGEIELAGFDLIMQGSFSMNAVEESLLKQYL
jgi:hypothetical protein